MDERFVGIREFHGDVHRNSAFSSVFFQGRSNVPPPRPNESQDEHKKYCAEKYRNADHRHPNHPPTRDRSDGRPRPSQHRTHHSVT